MQGANIDMSLQHNALHIDEVLPSEFKRNPTLDSTLKVRTTATGVLKRTVVGEVNSYDRFRKEREVERIRKIKEQLRKGQNASPPERQGSDLSGKMKNSLQLFMMDKMEEATATGQVTIE